MWVLFVKVKFSAHFTSAFIAREEEVAVAYASVLERAETMWVYLPINGSWAVLLVFVMDVFSPKILRGVVQIDRKGHPILRYNKW